ncbi:MAG: DUF7305 domain-containing protein [Candidatus Caldatribacteriaceae bacterium]
MRYDDERGSMLILVIFTVAALATILTAAASLFTSGTRSARATTASLQAHYLAEMAVEKAIKQLQENWNNVTPSSLTDVYDSGNTFLGQYRFTFSTPAPDKRINEGKGTVANHTKELIVEIQNNKGLPPIFRNALASNTDIDLTGNSRIYSSNEKKAKGNVYGHQKITVKGNTSVSGSVSSALIGGITIQGNVSIGGGTFAGPQYAQTIPTISEDLRKSWEDKAKTGTIYAGGLTYNGNNNVNFSNTYINGDLTLNGNSTITLENDVVIYVKGKVKITGNASIKGQGIIVSEGIIDLTGNMSHQLNQPANIAFVSLSDLESKITGNGEITGVFSAPNGTLKIAGNSQIFGSVVAHKIDFTGNADIKYNADLMDSDITWNPSKTLQMNQWKEI